MTPPEPDLTDWFLTREGRRNPDTRLDTRHPEGRAWSEGNRVRPLIDGAAYFAELHERLEATGDGDLVLVVCWEGDGDQRLTDDPDSEVAEVLCRAVGRGVDVRGLFWHSRVAAVGGAEGDNLSLGERLQERGAEVLLDLRVRSAGSHHQKFVVIRHRDDPSRDVAYVGGIDLCHSRRDDAEHAGDPQVFEIADEYGETPGWHDVQAAVTGPAVFDVETVFRERWEDPTPLTRSPLGWLDRIRGVDLQPSPLPPQADPPPSPEGGGHLVQLLRTYPRLGVTRHYAFARQGERSVALGITRAVERAEHLVHVEDQYLWSPRVGRLFAAALRDRPDLRVVAVVPRFTDLTGMLGRTPQQLGRHRALAPMLEAAPERVGVYGIENAAGLPVYVHAKVCLVDDAWASIGSANLNRRSWTHDSELTVAAVDPDGTLVADLRRRLAAEHLGCDPDEVPDGPAELFAAYADAAGRLDAWHAAGRQGPRPPGQLRRLSLPPLGPVTRTLASVPYRFLHDRDGRGWRMRLRNRF